ncbi:hypothetical protein F4553_002169 [Allocatelliglobosispora scoriae]|uniref:Secreted protein n=1 Tax=Allocatelliglobosispora scoriae TaxID=643052 RepID=A0A841BPP5_9ACTN|nr:hypothetical protein [Allocatelliglobosispora scoriae]MBB5868790.1 hypothetical protein [Allocatelliglobosispora scoriae]
MMRKSLVGIAALMLGVLGAAPAAAASMPPGGGGGSGGGGSGGGGIGGPCLYSTWSGSSATQPDDGQAAPYVIHLTANLACASARILVYSSTAVYASAHVLTGPGAASAAVNYAPTWGVTGLCLGTVTGTGTVYRVTCFRVAAGAPLPVLTAVSAGDPMFTVPFYVHDDPHCYTCV